MTHELKIDTSALDTARAGYDAAVIAEQTARAARDAVAAKARRAKLSEAELNKAASEPALLNLKLDRAAAALDDAAAELEQAKQDHQQAERVAAKTAYEKAQQEIRALDEELVAQARVAGEALGDRFVEREKLVAVASAMREDFRGRGLIDNGTPHAQDGASLYHPDPPRRLSQELHAGIEVVLGKYRAEELMKMHADAARAAAQAASMTDEERARMLGLELARRRAGSSRCRRR